MLLSLCLLLPALSPSSQEICSAPGPLPAPTLYLNQTASPPEGSVWLQCFVSSQNLVARVIFCKDGEEVANQTSLERKSVYGYPHVVSRDSAGDYACAYEIKNSSNHLIKSQLSPAKHLRVTGPDLRLPLGITIPVLLVLAVVLYLLGRKGILPTSLISVFHCLPVTFPPRGQREHVQHDTRNAPEDHLHYASMNWSESATDPPPQSEETSTYVEMVVRRERCH
nr:uncharacterized protein LOC112546747 isoform X1 [Pelodiscus sinensis]|eukprot:XP_025043383.1 uncharacterized protein LOC112546747 isoform X1 [Pelodiscus sinensis]